MCGANFKRIAKIVGPSRTRRVPKPLERFRQAPTARHTENFLGLRACHSGDVRPGASFAVQRSIVCPHERHRVYAGSLEVRAGRFRVATMSAQSIGTNEELVVESRVVCDAPLVFKVESSDCSVQPRWSHRQS